MKQTNQTSQKLSKEEAVVAVVPDAVPFKNTTVGKTVRTFLQAAAGILLVFVASDEFRGFISDRYPELVILLPLAVSLFTAVMNGLDKNVKNF